MTKCPCEKTKARWYDAIHPPVPPAKSCEAKPAVECAAGVGIEAKWQPAERELATKYKRFFEHRGHSNVSCNNPERTSPEHPTAHHYAEIFCPDLEGVESAHPMLVRARPGRHMMIAADSTAVRYDPSFDLVLTCPPYFHPSRPSSRHGLSPMLGDLDAFASWAGAALARALGALKPGRPLCFVKTDVKYRRTLLPVGFRIASEIERHGAPLRAHWIWERLAHFSPYAPSVANIFIFGDVPSEALRCGGVFWTSDCRNRSHSTTYTPELFEALVRQLTAPGDNVLDPFAGAGSVVVAAARSMRWSVGLELSRRMLVTRARAALRGIDDVTIRVGANSKRGVRT